MIQLKKKSILKTKDPGNVEINSNSLTDAKNYKRTTHRLYDNRLLIKMIYK